MRRIEYIQKEIDPIQITLTPDRLTLKGNFNIESIKKTAEKIQQLLQNEVVEKSWRGSYRFRDNIQLFNDSKKEKLEYEFSNNTEDNRYSTY